MATVSAALNRLAKRKYHRIAQSRKLPALRAGKAVPKEVRESARPADATP